MAEKSRPIKLANRSEKSFQIQDQYFRPFTRMLCRRSCMFFSFSNRGCQMVYFKTKNPNLGKFWRALECKMFVYFRVIGNILRPFGIHILYPLGNLVVSWYIFPRFGTHNIVFLIFIFVANLFWIDCPMIRNSESDRCGILFYARSKTPISEWWQLHTVMFKILFWRSRQKCTVGHPASSTECKWPKPDLVGSRAWVRFRDIAR
jgi:hypothetical protein